MLLQTIFEGDALPGIHFGVQPRQLDCLVLVGLKIEQKRRHLAPLGAGEGAQVIFDFNDTHGVKIRVLPLISTAKIHAGQGMRRFANMRIMCIFTGKVEEVKNTRIFARLRTDGHQVLIYQMSVKAPQDLAMVLPIPIKKAAGENAVKFFDFSKYETVFRDLWKCFPTWNFSPDPAAPAYSSRGALSVVSVGAYDASFVPTIADFSRLDARFRLPDDVWAKLPGYANFGFAVFKLKPGYAQVHPMAFSFPTAQVGTVFFPTLHIHDGKVHAKERFDHTLYFQGAGLDSAREGWEESFYLPDKKVKCGSTHGLIRPDLHVFRSVMRGKFENGDVVVKPRKV